jgi:GTP:adenosylcobinamide-phosphate guanylyltransferase
MDAIVTAGGIPQPDDPLYAYSNGASKAMIDVAGKPMIQWVLDALGEARGVDNVILIGLASRTGISCKKPVHFISNQGRMLANIVAGVDKARELNPDARYVLIVSSDIPGIKAGMVDWLIDTAMQTRDDLYYSVVPRPIMEKRYPKSKRTYTRLKDIEVCGADLHVAHVRMAAGQHLELWEELIGDRKSPMRQAARVGLDIFFQVAIQHNITLDDLVARVSERLGIKGRVPIWDHAEPGMDVDKPFQLEILRADLARQQRRAAAALAGPARKPKKKIRKSAVRKAAGKKIVRPSRKPARRPKAAARRPAGKGARKSAKKGTRRR